jgi:alkylation response protein AidB-like acyl-CoA dehydrogenase
MTATTTTRPDTDGAAEVLAAAERLAPTITSRAPEIEAGRRIPRDLLDDLLAAGCFRILVPRSHGGVGADLATAMRLNETLARADGSVGWTVMIGAGAWFDLSALPRPSFDALFAHGPDVLAAGAFNPTGRIVAEDGGYRVTGRWGFASGCEHANWLFGNSVEGVVDGVPQLRIAVFAPDEVTIEDTWNVSGLCGTGSHHFRVDDAFVPADRTFRPLVDAPSLDAPIVRIPPPSVIPLLISSVALGIARGALDDIVSLSAEKVPLLAPAPLAADPVFHLDLADADTELRAARALVYEVTEEVWAAATAGDELSMEQRARVRAAGVWCAARAAVVVETAYRSGGGSSLYAESPLQRRLRDIHALTQHFLVRRNTLVTAGAVMAGQDVQVMVF